MLRSRFNSQPGQDSVSHDLPGGCLRINELEMPDAGQDLQLAIVIARARGSAVSLAHFDRNRVVVHAVNQSVRYTKGQQLFWRALPIALGYLRRTAAEKYFNDSLTEAELSTTDEVDGTCERHGPSQLDRGCGTHPDVAVPRRRPQRQLTAGRKAHDHNARQIERIARRKLGQEVHRAAYVVHGPRPSASFFTDAAVFDVPSGYSSGRERGAQVRVSLDAVLRPPPPAVNAHDDGERSSPVGHSQIAELAGRRAVVQTSVERWQRSSQQVEGALHRATMARRAATVEVSCMSKPRVEDA